MQLPPYDPPQNPSPSTTLGVDGGSVPGTVRHAFTVMLGGGALSALRMVIDFVQVDAHVLDSEVAVSLVDVAVIGLISTGLWLSMAYACRAGSNWARVAGTILFVLYCLSVSGIVGGVIGFCLGLWIVSRDSKNLARATGMIFGLSCVTGVFIAVWVETSIISRVHTSVAFFVALAAVVLLWTSSSSEYFQPNTPPPHGR